jgi:integrase
MVGERVHAKHIQRILGESTRLGSITTAALQDYVNKRRKQKRRGKATSGPTIKKELVTFTQIWAWAKRRGYVRRDCPIYDENRKWTIEIPKAPEKEKFQTWAQIQSRIERGALSETAQAEMWASLFLDNQQVIELLDHVKANAAHSFIYPMFVFAAYTGARRSEICRSRVEDFDFDVGRVKIRERKRKRSKSESVRFVDLHPRLAKAMKQCFFEHPGGPYTIAIPLKMQKRKTRTEFSQMTPREAHYHFKEPLANSKWSVLTGWHVLRHSFGSNLARAGVPRDRIADWMGHSTEEMKELYQHLFPQDGASQIAALA